MNYPRDEFSFSFYSSILLSLQPSFLPAWAYSMTETRECVMCVMKAGPMKDECDIFLWKKKNTHKKARTVTFRISDLTARLLNPSLSVYIHWLPCDLSLIISLFRLETMFMCQMQVCSPCLYIRRTCLLTDSDSPLSVNHPVIVLITCRLSVLLYQSSDCKRIFVLSKQASLALPEN